MAGFSKALLTVTLGCYVLSGCISAPVISKPVVKKPRQTVVKKPVVKAPVVPPKAIAKPVAPKPKPQSNASNISNPTFAVDGNVKTVQKKSSGTVNRFQGYSWFVTELYGNPTFVYKEAPWISFKYSGKAQGSSGCYLLQGIYDFKPDTNLRVNVRSGRESCKTANEQTMMMLKALMETRNFSLVENKELVLLNSASQPVLKAVIKY